MPAPDQPRYSAGLFEYKRPSVNFREPLDREKHNALPKHASSRSEPCDGQPYLLRSRHLPKLPLPSQSLHPPTSLTSLLESAHFNHHWLPKVQHPPLFSHAELPRAEL